MSFDFNFDTSILDHYTNSSPESLESEKVNLVLLKKLLQGENNEHSSLLKLLSDQLDQEFLLYLGLLNEHKLQDFNCQIQEIMQLCTLHFRHYNFKHNEIVILNEDIEQSAILNIFNQLKIYSYMEKVQQEYLLSLLTTIPFVMGYAKYFSIRAINRFDERIDIQINDLVSLNSLLRGGEEIKVDLASLITLEVSVPDWPWKSIALLTSKSSTKNSISYKKLKQQLDYANKKSGLEPLIKIKNIFEQVKKNAEQNIRTSKQHLSALTKALLNEDQFNAKDQEIISSLHSKVRQQISELQKNSDELIRFCSQFESDLQSILA